jgi:hypothetical protein
MISRYLFLKISQFLSNLNVKLASTSLKGIAGLLDFLREEDFYIKEALTFKIVEFHLLCRSASSYFDWMSSMPVWPPNYPARLTELTH